MQAEVQVQQMPQSKGPGPSTPKAKRPPRQGRNNSERESGKITPKSPGPTKQVSKSPKGWGPIPMNSGPTQQLQHQPQQQSSQPKSPGKPKSPKSKVSIKTMDMPDEMQRFAVQTAEMALNRNTIEKNVASDIKKEFDARYGSPWHCVVGRSFGTFVTHEARHFAFFYVDQLAILLFKTN